MNRNINKHIQVLLLAVFLLGLSCSQPSRLELALEAAGANRAELEKVLKHFRDDPLKLKAAIFLIENMPGHYSFVDTAFFNQFNNALDSLTFRYGGRSVERRRILWRDVYSKYIRYSIGRVATVPDVEIITAEFLIRNIEQAFEVWKESPWAQHLSFEDFCELILPYKVMQGQEFDNWREYCRTMFNHSLDIIRHIPLLIRNPVMVGNIVNQNMRREIYPRISFCQRLPITRMSTLLQIPAAMCDDYAVMILAVMRAKGIPVAIDFTPQWPFRSRGHSWNVLLKNTGKMGIFEGIGTPVGTPHKQDHIMAKVYRKTFAINREIERIHQVESAVPDFLRTPFIKDVTDEYMVTTDVTIPLRNRPDFHYAYLAVFDNANWVPISWGRASRRSVTFRSMGHDVVYLPVRYTRFGGVEAIGNPFILTIRGDVRELAPDTLNRQTLRLYRKFPLMPRAFIGVERLIGAEIQAANEADFSDLVTIHRFDDVKKDIRIDYPSQKFRYWRFLSAPDGFVNLAEMLFWERGSEESIWGEIIGTSGSRRSGNRYRKQAVFDGNFLTFFYAPVPTDAWVGMDFGKPVDIARIVCFMRADGNYIEPGDEYELLYWRDGGWQSLGRKIATDFYLVYENSPTNALFLLRNHTKGIEERIFTYENGRQVFW